MNQLKYFLLILLLFAGIAFSPAASPLVGNADVAFASSDPVIAAAGDIACDPANSVFNGGLGNSSAVGRNTPLTCWWTQDIPLSCRLEIFSIFVEGTRHSGTLMI